ncbi:hypothetical protein CI102_8811 [Trichoderma harzianum]|nr:hypothetical protein CI102_8811 [Trichoderma harzianum]
MRHVTQQRIRDELNGKGGLRRIDTYTWPGGKAFASMKHSSKRERAGTPIYFSLFRRFFIFPSHCSCRKHKAQTQRHRWMLQKH